MNAGVLAFVGRSDPALDYTYREFAGGDSRARVNRGRRGLLEELQEAFTNFTARNDIHHLPRGIPSGQVSNIPAPAAREAMVNGLAHRDWTSPQPVVVEHVGRTLRVTSPGGFYGGVNSENIITHPSQPRNRALAELLASLRIAEREGIGVDRMIGSMVRYGHPRPRFEELSSPFVRASLVGDETDVSWIQWISDVLPQAHSDDLNLLLLRRLVDHAWLDVASSAPDLQLNSAETAGAIERLIDATTPLGVVQFVAGVPGGTGRLDADGIRPQAALRARYRAQPTPQ